MHQIVYAKLNELNGMEITAPARSIIVQITAEEFNNHKDISEGIAGLGECLLGIEITDRDLTDYIYLNEEDKSVFVKELHRVNTVGEILQRPVFFVCKLAKKFPEWDTCYMHVRALLSQYKKLFPSLILTCKNTVLTYGRTQVSDASPAYILDYFKNIEGVDFLIDVTVPGIASAMNQIKDSKSRIIAIEQNKNTMTAEELDMPVIYKGVNFLDMVRSCRNDYMPEVKVVRVPIAGTDDFMDSLLNIIGTMNK